MAVEEKLHLENKQHFEEVYWAELDAQMAVEMVAKMYKGHWKTTALH